jgi:phosphatidylserine/phosphatidylglycerophosphate/cardiolipin synthase-like enzyme
MAAATGALAGVSSALEPIPVGIDAKVPFIQGYPREFLESKQIPPEFLAGDPAQWRLAIEKTRQIYRDILQNGYRSQDRDRYAALMALNYVGTKRNRMELLVGRDYWDELIPLIRSAQKSIDIMIYGWQTNETWPLASWNPKYGGEFLEDEICPAVRRGVHVNLIVSNPKYSVWGSPFTPALWTRTLGKAVNPITQALIGRRLVKHDIGMPDFFDALVEKTYRDPTTGEVKWLCRGPDGRPPRLLLGFTWKDNLADIVAHQDHRKIHIIDGKVALIGGFAYCTKMRDLMLDHVLKVEGPLAQQLQSTFFLTYAFGKGVLADFPPACAKAGDPQCRSLRGDDIDRVLDEYFPPITDEQGVGFTHEGTLVQNNPYIQGDDLYDHSGNKHLWRKGEKAKALLEPKLSMDEPEAYDPLLGGASAATRTFQEIIRSATTNIQLTNGNITDQGVMKLLVQRYVETGCKLSIDVLNPFNIEVRFYYAKPNREALRLLVAETEEARRQHCGGVGEPVVIRDFVGGEQDVAEGCSRWGGMGYIHCKVMLTPTVASLGSTNLDRFSLYRQIEAQIVTHDPEVIADIHRKVFMQAGGSQCSLPRYDGETKTLADVSRSVLRYDYTLDFPAAVPLRTADDIDRFIKAKYGYRELPTQGFRAFPQDSTEVSER